MYGLIKKKKKLRMYGIETSQSSKNIFYKSASSNTKAFFKKSGARTRC